MMMLEGISNKIYGTKKIVSATLGCTPERPRSPGRPIGKALPILTLEAGSKVNKARCCQFPRSVRLPIKKSDDVDDEQDGYEPPVNLFH